MSRRRRAEKREVLPDPKFGDLTLTKFMNYLMYDGKKSAAEGIVYGALEIVVDGVALLEQHDEPRCDLEELLVPVGAEWLELVEEAAELIREADEDAPEITD